MGQFPSFIIYLILETAGECSENVTLSYWWGQRWLYKSDIFLGILGFMYKDRSVENTKKNFQVDS